MNPAARIASTACLLSGALMPFAGVAAPDRVSDFALLDARGEFHQLGRYLHRDALVLMAHDPDCQAMGARLEAFTRLAESLADANLGFVLIDSRDQNTSQADEIHPHIPLLLDHGQLVSESLAISHAGEVLVLDPKRTSLLYRGGTGSELQALLGELENGSADSTVVVPMAGCDIAYPVRERHQETIPDYASQVAPIIIRHCTECHRRDGVGPFPMDSHVMLMGWSPMIREVLLNKRMPPAQVDPRVGYSPEARYIETEELQTLVHWIDAGAPRGEAALDPLEQLDFSGRDRWILGEPDYVVAGPANAIAATGVMDYLYQDVELPFTEDRWVRAVQYLAGDESVLHHLVTNVTAPGEDFWGAERDQASATRRFLAAYAPGAIRAVEFPPATGVLIPAGHKLSMQYHYVTNGRATLDQTRLGLYFHDRPPAQERLTQAVAARFTLPPGNPELELEAVHVFDEAVTLAGLRAHMHFRGKKMKFVVVAPDGRRRELLSVPAYNYGWQPHYLLAEPLTLAAGSAVHVIGALDNSPSNPANPDPDLEIPFGFNSWEEMFTGYWTFQRPRR